jgi:hypothetical protein
MNLDSNEVLLRVCPGGTPRGLAVTKPDFNDHWRITAKKVHQIQRDRFRIGINPKLRPQPVNGFFLASR